MQLRHDTPWPLNVVIDLYIRKSIRILLLVAQQFCIVYSPKHYDN